jgi:hypothetical protein
VRDGESACRIATLLPASARSARHSTIFAPGRRHTETDDRSLAGTPVDLGEFILSARETGAWSFDFAGQQ